MRSPATQAAANRSLAGARSLAREHEALGRSHASRFTDDPRGHRRRPTGRAQRHRPILPGIGPYRQERCSPDGHARVCEPARGDERHTSADGHTVADQPVDEAVHESTPRRLDDAAGLIEA